MSKFYLKGVHEKYGPYSLDELETKKIIGETFVQKEDETNWRKAEDSSELKSLFNPELKKANDEPYWGSFKSDHCTGNGYQQYSAILWGIPWGKSWEETCANTPATINGYYFPYPSRCKKAVNIWGEFDVPASNCAQAGSFHTQSLMILHGPKTIANFSAVQNAVDDFKGLASAFTWNKLSIETRTVTLPGSFKIGPDFDGTYNMPDFNKQSLITNLRNTLNVQGVNLDSYHSFFLIYDDGIEGKTAKHAAGLSWAWNKAVAIHFPTGDKLEEVILHEFLHLLDYYFEINGYPGFINSDCFTGGQGCKRNYSIDKRFKGANLDFYRGIMRLMDNGGYLNYSPVDYRKLHRSFGLWR